MNLEELRSEIDIVDGAIIDLIARRFEVTKLVGELKAEADVDALSPNREREQFERFKRLSEDLDLPYCMVEKVFEAIRDQVLINHRKMKAEYQSK